MTATPPDSKRFRELIARSGLVTQGDAVIVDPVFTTIPGALVSSSTESRIESAFGSASTGRTLYVRVTNTVTAGAKNRTVNVDLLAITTASPSGP